MILNKRPGIDCSCKYLVRRMWKSIISPESFASLLVVMLLSTALTSCRGLLSKKSAVRKNLLRMVSQHQPPFSSSSYNNEVASQKNFLDIDFSATTQSKFQRLVDYRPVIVGIAGGSASGKTTMARAIIENLGEEHISFIGHDNYYKNLHHLSLEDRGKVNFDHPDSLDTSLLIDHVQQLKNGQEVHIPTYDFNTHSRTSVTLHIQPRKIILVDGILIFSEPELIRLMDLKIFVDTADDIRLIRRIGRDTRERGRSVESVIDQYMKTVRPMHDLYVEPSKRKADIIVPAGDGISPAALEMCVSRLREIINFYQ